MTRTVILPTTPRTLLAARIDELPRTEWQDAGNHQYAATYEGFTAYGDTIHEACDLLATQLLANAEPIADAA